MLNALDIHVSGIVQGVGFRPFVYRLAKRYLVNGWVLNAIDGVHIHAEGDEKLVDEFVLEIANNAPAAAQVKQIDMREVPLEGFDGFEIRLSDATSAEETTLVSADLATCDDCLAELFDPVNRRYRYPFINCTNCGPRFTIIDSLPYDRPTTSMASFAMCESCASEYADPADRRFHAQPDACWDCGPHLCFTELAHTQQTGGEVAQSVPIWEWGTTRETSDALLARVVQLLDQGGIAAVKGLGGFHVVCDASQPATLARLRSAKRREGKAFAVMVPDIDAARAYCQISDEEAALLASPARPIVLLKKQPGVQLAPGLADRLPELGIMLPATPLQHVLLEDFVAATGRTMLVFTSGNMHDEPIQIDDSQACQALAGIADCVLGNDRAIRARYDDSVVRVLDFGSETAVQVIRRARGYAPVPIALPDVVPVGKSSSDPEIPVGKSSSDPEIPTTFATGPEQKNTFCFAYDNRAFVSQHIGDMENAATYDAWLDAKATYERLFGFTPSLVACDFHPEYLTSKWAASQELPVVQVQHHHAHIVSAMAENALAEPVCGIAFDGTGYGVDGAIWGGEVLLANLVAFERFANFAYFPLPGGAAAIKHPLRAAYGALWAFDLLEHPAAARVLEALGEEASLCEHMIEANLNTPYTSSVGRLFDAASAILGLCTEATYEGEPAVLLEAALKDRAEGVPPEEAYAAPATSTSSHHSYAIDIVKNTATENSTAQDTSVVLLDAAPLFKAMLDDVAAGVERRDIARCFHDAFVGAIVQVAQLVEAAYDIRSVVLSGGVFMNRYLTEGAVCALTQAGFTAVLNKDLPPNDGCISFGQAVVGLSRVSHLGAE